MGGSFYFYLPLDKLGLRSDDLGVFVLFFFSSKMCSQYFTCRTKRGDKVLKIVTVMIFFSGKNYSRMSKSSVPSKQVSYV